MKITCLGTTTLLLDDGRDQLLFDCHVTRPSLGKYLFGRLSTDRDVADRVIRDFGIDRLRGIFISHSHHDHVLDAPYFAQRCGAAVYGSPSALNVARGGGVAEDRLYSFADGLEYRVGGYHVAVLPSVHSAAHWYNDDLGQTIDAPVVQPAKRRAFKEGGSFDFLVENDGLRCLIRPSYSFLPGQLDHVRADALLLGIGGLSRDSAQRRAAFFAETVDKVKPRIVIPLHWDNFFAPLYGPVRGLPRIAENTDASLHLLAEYCARQGVACAVVPPLGFMTLDN